MGGKHVDWMSGTLVENFYNVEKWYQCQSCEYCGAGYLNRWGCSSLTCLSRTTHPVLQVIIGAIVCFIFLLGFILGRCCPPSNTPPAAADGHHGPPAGEHVEKGIDMSQYNTSPNAQKFYSVDDMEPQIEKHHAEYLRLR